MLMKEKTDREQFNERLQKAFGKDWVHLSHETKESILDKLLEIDEGPGLRNEFDLKEMLDEIQGRSLSVGTIIIGSIVAIFGGLTVNILHDFLKVQMLYHFIAPIGFFVLLFVLDRLLDNSITERHKKKDTLSFLLKLIDDKKSDN